MRRKKFMLALVAMLSFTFSAFAQTTVTTEAELKTAMSSANSIVLDADITLQETVVIPKKIAVTLDLNGHRIEGVTTGQNGISLQGNASLTINDSKGTGVITAKSYVLNGAGGSKIILNAGKIYRSSWAVYTTGSFVINGGTVECNDGSMAIRVAGSGTVTLNAGTVTSVQVSGGTLNVQDDDATITSGIQLDKGAKDVNITAGTINGDITVAPEVTADKITISGGTIKDADISDYLEDGKIVTEDGQVVAGMFQIGDAYYPTLAEAVAAAQPGQTIVLLKDTDEAYVLPVGVKFDNNGFNAPNIKVAVAKVGEVGYSDIQEAIKAAAPAGTVDVLADVTVDKWVMFAEKMTIGDGSLITLNINGLTINGNNKTLTVKSIESAGNGGYLFYDAQNLTVKDLTINIADGLVGGIGLQQGTISNVTFNGGQYGVLPGKNGVTVSGCTFNDTKGYAVYYEDARPGIVVTGNTFNTADGKYAITMRSNEQFTNNTITKGRVNLANSAASTVSGNDFGTERFKVYNGATATISNNKINNLVFNETTAPAASTFTADNTLSAEAQAAIEALPVMAGDGTEANPYTIGNLTQLKEFRDEVNAGNNYQGKFVKLTADIDLNNEEWTPIGNVTYDSKYKPTDASKVFSGVFNGNGKVISNLKVASTVGGVDTQANVGLFGITGEGAVIKDLTLTNVNIETDGRNVGALAGFAYKATLSNITVNGNIQIKGGNNVAGVAGMTRYYAMSATGISVIGNDGSAIVGNNIVGGIFAEIAPNGSEQKFDGLNVENVAITGVGGVGGIVGLLTTGAVENVSVKNVALTGRTDYQGNAMGRIRLGSVAGLMGGKYATIANEVIDNVTAKNLDGNAVELPVIGANYDAASNATEAKIGNNYYATLAAALAAEGDEVELFVPVTVAKDETRVLDLKGKTVSHSKVCTASYEMIKNLGNLTIKNGILSFTDTSAGDPSFGWGSYTINNYGTLVVEEGATIQHLGAQEFATHMIAAIQQAKGSTTINGGVISTPNYRSVRINGGALAINGGEFDGQVWLQPNQGDVTIAVNGGTFGPNGGDGSSIFMTNVGENKTVTSASITGGTFTTKIGCSDAAALAGIITGGKFTEAAKENTNSALLATGFEFSNLVDGYHTVVDDPTTHYIANKADLIAFRDAVNSGENYYAGVNVYLAADIDLAGVNWAGIGTATADHGFMGNFDGKNFKIKNLTIDNPTLDSDGYAYAGLFGVTEGTDKDNQNVIKNLIIENVTINTTGDIVSAAIAYPYYTIVDNVKVCGDIKIQGGKYTAGVLAYTRRCVNASNLSIAGNDGSYVKGTQTVGGVISDIQMNGGLTAVYSNFSAEGITVTGEKSVGGIAGIIATQTLNGATVKNVTLNSTDEFAGVVAGRLGGTSTISNVVSENVTGATAVVGATYDGAKAVEARIGDIYYSTFAAAYNVAQADETITLLADIEATEVILLDKSVTINGNGHKVTSNATRVFRATTANTKVTLNDVKMVSTAVRVGTNDVRGISIDIVDNVELTLNNSSVDFTDASANDWAYAVNVTGGNNHVVFVNGGEYEGANVINVRGANNTVTVEDATLTSTYPNNGQFYGACIWVLQNQGSSVEATGNTFNGSNAIAFNLGTGTVLTESDNTDNTKYVVAMIGDAYYTSIQAAVEAARNGETINLTQNVKMDTKTLATQNDGYSAIVNVEGKAVTLDLNGKTVAVDVEAADLDGAAGKMLLAVFHADLNGALTLVDNSADKAGKVIVNANEDAKVYSLGASESCVSDKSQNGTLTINGGTYIINKVKDSMFFTDADGKIVINGGTFELGNIATGANGSPWIFNTYGQNGRQVIVNGGTFNADVNHQFWANEVFVPRTKALKDNGDGTWTTVDAVAYTEELATSTYAYSRMIGYATVEEAMAATGKYNCIDNAVALVKDVEVESSIVVAEGVEAVLDLNGKVLSMNDASGATAALIKNNGILTIDDRSEAKSGKISFKSTIPSAANAYASNAISNYGTITVKAGVIENLTVGGACYALDNYAGSTATIEGGKLTAEKTAVRIFNWTNGEAAKATLNVNGGEVYSKDGYAINVNSGNAPSVALNITGGTITTDDTDYNLAVYVINKGTAENFTANVTGGVFNGNFALNGVTATTMKENAVSISGGEFEGVICYETPAYGFVSGGTFDAAVDAKYVATGYICKDNGDGTFGVVVNPEYGKIAQIGNGSVFENQYFATLNDAAQAAKTGDVIKLIADVNISAAGYATVDEENQYSTMMAVKEKDITLDMNGKTITVTPTADELADAEMQMLMSVFGMDTNGKLTITGNGTVKVVANDAQVYSIVTAYGEGSLVTIENGNFEADKLMLSGSLFYSQQSECIIVNGGNFSLGNLADPEGQNGQPWIFNTKGQNYTGAIVNGGTFPTDINHQFWAHEVRVPETKALKLNAEGRWDVVDAVAYTTEKASSRGSYYRNIGYASIEDAIAATDKYNCEDNVVTLIKDIAIETEVKIANGTTVVLDLNGKTIAGTDKGTASFGLITNRGDLTIQDSSEGAAGKITLAATQNRGWAAYSSVISNNPGGKLTVQSGTIEHLGGTSMAWGIDNLTNGKGTYAETEINGGLVNSAYIAIRQFLNGVEAQNILTVNDGILQGGTASLYFQDPSKNANTGTLDVFEDATLAGDVYLDVTKGSTEWPVEVYITKAALGEYEIHTENIPEDAAALVEYAEFWQVEQKNLAELTIVDEDYAEYINKVEKTVGMLTYERTFENAEWQTLYLPFEVPVANLMNDFDVAYIYNAGYKNSTATLDYVVIEDANFVLAANYPYLIRAKETGVKSIVVENAKLMPTEINTIDCSSVFEKFVFAGNYSTLDASTLDAKKGYFDMNAGNWSRMDVLNPFRVYMQIELRNGNGSDFVYPTESQKIRMRRVDENGEASGIDEVDAEQGVDYIFDLHGRRVAEPQKGQLYIINGKKVVF